MKIKPLFTKIREHWGVYVLILCFGIGIALLKPVFELFPVILKVVTIKLPYNNAHSEKIEMGTITEASELLSYSVYLPIFNHEEILIEKTKQKSTSKSPLSFFDFSPQSGQISMTIAPQRGVSTSNNSVNLSFIPDHECIYGEGRACIYNFVASDRIKVTFISAHSGTGGEGEPFRDLIEGTGINTGLFTAKQVANNTQTLIGADVSIKQGGLEVSGLKLVAIARIPPEQLDTYFSLPIEHTLDFAIEIGALNPKVLNKNIFVFETCGWHLPGERNNPNFPNASQSIYLGIIQ
jgi:hypothetical protein